MLKEVYFLNSRELSERLHRNDVPEMLAFYHLLIYSMIFSSHLAIPFSFTCSSNETSSWGQIFISFIIIAAVQFWGMNLLYKTNKKGDGKAFFLRWAALSLPVGMQLFVISFITFIIFGGILLSVSKLPDLSKNNFQFIFEVFSLLFQYIYFKLMQKNLTICSSGPQKAAPA